MRVCCIITRGSDWIQLSSFPSLRLFFFPLQSWKQLSRFQRSLLYMVLGVALVIVVFYYFTLDKKLVRSTWGSLGHLERITVVHTCSSLYY